MPACCRASASECAAYEQSLHLRADPATGRSLKVSVEGGRIVAIEPGPDGETAFLSPGLIDLQVNGFAGHDLNADGLTPATVLALADALRATGVTTFVPTLITASESAITAALRVIAAARADNRHLAHTIPFIHVEGPSFSPEDGPRGAHPLAHVRAPDLAEFERWQEASGNLVGMVTLSPHFGEAPAYIRALTLRGVHVAIGHTHATPDQITAAVDAGATLSTHLGNGAAAQVPRHPNFIWTQLADDRLTATFIADGHHLPADTFKAMVRAKGIKRSILVSDAVALGGMPPGLYEQPVGGRVELTSDGRLGVAGTPYLAGAARPLADGVAFAAGIAAFGLATALTMATANPGRLTSGRGQIRMSGAADLIRFRWAPGDHTLRIEDVTSSGDRA
jgi:N-acetylglucosamine-6-phosphate deacetylase